jgi:Ca2+-binding EF-hand superfamily protein
LDLTDPAVNTRPPPSAFTLSNPLCASPTTFHPLSIKSMLHAHFRSLQTQIPNVTLTVEQTFTTLDTNSDSYLSKDELKKGLDSLQQTYTDEELQRVLDLADSHKDGRISKKELSDYI